MSYPILSCQDFKDLSGAWCCGSCHGDEDMFGYELIQCKSPDNEIEAEVCCRMAERIEEACLLNKEWYKRARYREAINLANEL